MFESFYMFSWPCFLANSLDEHSITHETYEHYYCWIWLKREINVFNKILLFKSIFIGNVRQKFIVTYKEARVAYNTTKHQQ